MYSTQTSVVTDDRRSLIVRDKPSAFSEMQALPPAQDRNVIMGAYIPDNLHLEDMNSKTQFEAIREFLRQGFNEYFFVMDNFNE